MTFRRTRKGRGKKRRPKKRQTKFRNAVKRIARSAQETKRTIISVPEFVIQTGSLPVARNLDLTSVPQGITSFTRNGDKIQLVGHAMKAIFNNNGSTSKYIRVLMVRFVSNNQAAVTSTNPPPDLFETTDDTKEGVPANIMAMLWPVNHTQYKVLYNKLVKVSPSLTDQGSETKFLQVYIPNQSILDYEGGTSVIPFKNRVVLIFLATDAANDDVAGEQVEISLMIKTYFKDF